MKYLLITFPILLWSCNKENDETTETQYDNLSATVEYKQISGTDPDLLSLDIYYNSNTETQKPVVIWVHGGAWSIGDKTSQIENKVSLYQSLNYVFVSVNYRLSPYPYELDNPDRIMYPTHNNDVADAIKWVYDSIDQYGGNPNKIALLGHSAGGHLVALTGTNNSFLESRGMSLSNIKGVAAIDTEGYDVLAKVQDNTNLYINAFGTDSTSNVEASPVYNIEDGTTYPKFFVAKRGNAQRIAIANDFIETLESHGASVSEVDGSVYDHSGINAAIGEANETLITTPLTAFFAECFE